MSSSGRTSDEKKELHSSDASAISSKNISDLMQKAHIPGISIATISHGKMSENIALGLSDIESKVAVTTDTIFWACSLSKPVFAYLVILLIQNEKLGKDFTLDTPLWKIFDWTDYFNGDERRKNITTRMILSHQTGMPNEGGLEDKEGPDKHLNPGQLFRYSGQGYIYLQIVIEKITGLSLEELAQKEIFLPLGMKHSSFLLPEPEFIATTHDETMNPKLPLPLLLGNNNHPAASLHTTARDYALFLEASLQNKAFVEIALKTPHVSMEKDQEAVDKKVEQDTLQSIHWGLGFGLQKSPEKKAPDIAFHWGDGPGEKAFFAINLNSLSAIVFLANSQNGLAIAEDIATPIVGDIKPTINYLFGKYNFKNYLELEKQYQSLQSDVKNIPIPNNRLKWLHELKKCKEHPIVVEKDILQEYAGEYGPFKITLENNSLKMLFFGTHHELIPLSETLFVSKNDVTLRLEFNKKENQLTCQFLNPTFALPDKQFTKSLNKLTPNILDEHKPDNQIISVETHLQKSQMQTILRSYAGKFALKINEEKTINLHLIAQENKLFIKLPYPSPDDPYQQFELISGKLNSKPGFFSAEADVEIYFPEGNVNLMQFGSMEAKRIPLTSTAQFSVSTGTPTDVSTSSFSNSSTVKKLEVKGHVIDREKIINPSRIQKEVAPSPIDKTESEKTKLFRNSNLK